MNHHCDFFPKFREKFGNRPFITNIRRRVPIARERFFQPFARSGSRSFRSKKPRPQIIIHAHNLKALAMEPLRRFRPNQSRRTCNDDRAWRTHGVWRNLTADAYTQSVIPSGARDLTTEVRTGSFHASAGRVHARSLIPRCGIRDDSAEIITSQLNVLIDYSPIIHVTSPADGLTRAAGNCRSPASTRSISWGLFDAPTRNKI